jgi:Rrf2 family protein
MQVSARCEYACRAVLELSINLGRSISADQISKNQAIPKKYLTHILIELKKLNIVESIRGKQGGYILAHPPSKITLGQVVRLIDGPFVGCACMTTSKYIKGKKQIRCVFKPMWEKINKSAAETANSYSFEDIANSLKRSDTLEYQI